VPAADRLRRLPSTPDKTVGKSVAEATSGVGQTVKEAMDDARKDITQGNIKISADKQPRAEITPDGRLLIDGKDVPADEASAASCRSTAATWSPLRWTAWMSAWPAPSSAPVLPERR
jgi:hypothetical protein